MKLMEKFLTAGSFPYLKAALLLLLGAAVLWVYVSIIIRGLF